MIQGPMLRASFSEIRRSTMSFLLTSPRDARKRIEWRKLAHLPVQPPLLPSCVFHSPPKLRGSDDKRARGKLHHAAARPVDFAAYA